MRFYSIETAGQKHIFIGAEQDRSAPVPAFPGACVMRIAPSPDCDFRLEAVSGEPYPPDVLRAFSCFLSRVRGYPRCEVEVGIGGRRFSAEIGARREGGEELYYAAVGPCSILPPFTAESPEGRALSCGRCFCGGVHLLFAVESPERVDFSLLCGSLSRGFSDLAPRGAIALAAAPDADGAFRFVFCPAFGSPAEAIDSRAAAVCAAFLQREAGAPRRILLRSGRHTASVASDGGGLSVGLTCEAACVDWPVGAPAADEI